MTIKRIEVVKMEKDVKKRILAVIGVLSIIIGLILLLEYIWHFFKIFLGAFLVLLGIYFLFVDHTLFSFRRRKF